MSLAARLMNVFATPGDVFEDVKNSAPSTANWVVPVSLFGIVSAISVVIIFSQPAVVQKTLEPREKMIEQQANAGKISRESADKQIEVLEKYGPLILKITGGVGAVCMSFILLFGWAFVFWLLGRFFLKSSLNYMKLAEMLGLASAISVLQQIIKMLLVVSFSNPMASPSLAMLLKNPDPQNKLFMLLSALDVLTIWVLAVRSIGLAKLANVSFARAAVLVFASWWVLFGLMLVVTSAFQAAFGR